MTINAWWRRGRAVRIEERIKKQEERIKKQEVRRKKQLLELAAFYSVFLILTS